MMKTLMTTQEVTDLAFTAGEYLPASTLNPGQIAAAEEQCIRPIVGPKLFDELLTCTAESNSNPNTENPHKALLDDYVKPLEARCVKALMLPQLQLRTGACGVVSGEGGAWKSASQEALTSARKALKREIEALSRRLHRELERLHAAGELAAYEPEKSILNRCRIHGGFVQIL